MLSRPITSLCLTVPFLLAFGCGRQPATPSQPAPPQPAPQPTSPQPALPPSSATAPAASQPTEDTDSITVEFVEITKNARGEFVVVRMTNTTEKKIAGIRGSVRVLDADGNVIHGYGYTDALFNKAPGESVELPLLKIKPDGPLAAHRDGLAEFSYVYVAREITHAEE